jgi:hypothetical protein
MSEEPQKEMSEEPQKEMSEEPQKEMSEEPQKEMSEEPKSKGSTRERPKKRRRVQSEDDIKERILQQKKERFDKLLYQAKKQLVKQAKQCRTFLLQKHIRKMKKQGEDAVPLKLQSVKDLPLEHVVQQGVRQLGLLHANPDPNADFQQPEPLSPELKSQVDMILTHIRFQSVLEECHKNVTDYRRWALKLDERGEFRIQPAKGAKAKNPIPKQMQHQPMSLFCSLNDDGDGDGETTEMSPYGPGAYMETVPTKKNRQGQRARRAKAMAIEAKNKGKKYESLNWRSSEEKSKEQKPEERDHQDHSSRSAKREQPNSIVAFGDRNGGTNSTAPAEKQHPSWVAKQAQKSGIVAFKGTKITF